MIRALPTKQDIQWNSFNIGLNPGGNIQFSLPNSSSVLNGITGNGMTGGGAVFLTNTNGILFNVGTVNFTTAGLAIVSNQASVSSAPEANTGAMLLLGMGLLAVRRKHAC